MIFPGAHCSFSMLIQTSEKQQKLPLSAYQEWAGDHIYDGADHDNDVAGHDDNGADHDFANHGDKNHDGITLNDHSDFLLTG